MWCRFATIGFDPFGRRTGSGKRGGIFLWVMLEGRGGEGVTAEKTKFATFKSTPGMKQIPRIGETKNGRIEHTKIRVGDLVFDSVAEHDRYLELRVLEEQGIISELECQPRYEILPKQETPPGEQNFRPVIYTPDFRYRDSRRGGETVVEEVKSEYSRHEKDYVIRRKLIYYTMGVYVKEVIR